MKAEHEIDFVASNEKLYVYDEAKPDRLVSYNDQSISYNEIGNPLSYRGNAIIWQKGRQLTNYGTTAFTYDGSGRRITKGSIVYSYGPNGTLLKQSNGIEYMYDTSGMAGFKYGGNHYLYRKNAQGDVTHLYKVNSVDITLEACYTYDAWGNHKVLDANGNVTTNATHIGNINPIRYRSYMYDTETGLYYLQSRYYDPEVGRFLNADSIEYLDPESINGLNLYTYCLDNPLI